MSSMTIGLAVATAIAPRALAYVAYCTAHVMRPLVAARSLRLTRPPEETPHVTEHATAVVAVLKAWGPMAAPSAPLNLARSPRRRLRASPHREGLTPDEDG